MGTTRLRRDELLARAARPREDAEAVKAMRQAREVTALLMREGVIAAPPKPAACAPAAQG